MTKSSTGSTVMTEDEAFTVYCNAGNGGATQGQIHAVAIEQHRLDTAAIDVLREAARALLTKWPKCSVSPGCRAIAVTERTDDDCVPKDHACEEHFTRYMAIDMAWGLGMRVCCGEEVAALARLVGDG